MFYICILFHAAVVEKASKCQFFGVIVNCLAVSYRALVCFGQQQCTISTEMHARMLPTAIAPYWLPKQRKPELPHTLC